MLASMWLEMAEKYEERLQANQSLNPQVTEAILKERNRICSLFNDLLPEFAQQISIVVMPDAHAEHCSIFSWRGRIYVFVSAALIGRPYDHPEDTGLKAWEWLAHHELVHIRENHTSWFFYIRRLFRFTWILFLVQWFLLGIFASKQTLYTWLDLSLWFLGGIWFAQTILTLVFEWKADLAATRSIRDPAVLKDVEKSLYRMGMQARERWPFPLNWIVYIANMLFSGPHPPFIARHWLLQRNIRALEKNRQ